MNKQTKWTNDFFDRLDSLLEHRSWTINRLSMESGVSLNALYQMRRRHTLPNMQTIYVICEAFEISVSEFFMFDNPSNPNAIKAIERIKSLDPIIVSVLANLMDCLK